jgi:ubiquinone/menaquinone biosynthesis C-methylase UbiE
MSNEPPPKKLSNLHRVTKFYRDSADRYDDVYEENMWRLYDDLTWYFLQPALPPIIENTDPSRILDIGGGTAKWAIKLAQRGYRVLCGDISPEMLAIGETKVKELGLSDHISFQQLDIRDMHPLSNEAFDMVLAVGDVISYALDDDLAVAEIYRVLKPQGKCVASVDNTMIYVINTMKYDHFERIESLLQEKVTDSFSPHPVRTYLPEDLRNLFERHGFEVEQIVGKPVISSLISQKMRKKKLEKHYDLILALEKRFGAHPHFIGHGGHLQIIAKK